MDWNESWQECSLKQVRQFAMVAFALCHQGVDLFSAGGENLGVLAILKQFSATKCIKRAHKVHGSRNGWRLFGQCEGWPYKTLAYNGCL